MPTTEQVITQVQCQACGKSMSAKNRNLVMQLIVSNEFKKYQINQKLYQCLRKLYQN
jgi:hypothetical protein